MKVVRIYHSGRESSHRERDRALVAAGVDLTLVVPRVWPGADELTPESFPIVETDIRRPGDVNRHTVIDPIALLRQLLQLDPDVIDLHEEPFSQLTRQLLRRLPPSLPIVGYTAQNLDKRLPPPFAQWETIALTRLDGLYPCSRQAASVAAGKGFAGPLQILPLGIPAAFACGDQRVADRRIRLIIVGRLVPEKGVLDAVRAAALAGATQQMTLTVVGTGPEAEPARALAARLGVSLEMRPWLSSDDLAEEFRRSHILLAPSRTTRTWVEQFGRMVAEAQACGAVVVGYSSGSLPEVIGEAGVLTKEGDVAALADAVVELVANPEHWAALRVAGLDVARTRSWDSVATGQIDLYQRAIEARRASPAPRRLVRPQRRRAQEKYGPPAGHDRPFALPVLRRDTTPARALAWTIDRASRLRSSS